MATNLTGSYRHVSDCRAHAAAARRRGASTWSSGIVGNCSTLLNSPDRGNRTILNTVYIGMGGASVSRVGRRSLRAERAENFVVSPKTGEVKRPYYYYYYIIRTLGTKQTR